jgi:hypothetical protein
MSDNKKKRIDEGFIPQKPPKKPVEVEVEKGFVPPRSPKKPPAKSSNRK